MKALDNTLDNSERLALLLEIATRQVICLPPDASVQEAAHIMAERRISSIVVTDAAGHPAGIITERNFLRAIQSGNSPKVLLPDIMSTPVITVPSSITTLDAYRLCLSNGIRHLAIVDENGLLAGVVSETDFRLHLNLPTLAGRRKVATIAKRAAITLPPSTSLQYALQLMLDQHQSCAVVVEDEKPVGIITERDVVRLYSHERNLADIALGEVMVAPVLTIQREDTTSRAAETMLAHQVRHLVVVDEAGRMSGLVNEHDLTQTMVSGILEERNGLEENFLRTLIDTLPDLVWLKDINGVYLACNTRFEHFFGASEQEIVGRTDYDFVGQQQADRFRAHDLQAMAASQPSINEEWLTFAQDGYHGLFETVKTPMHDHLGKLVGVLGVARDVTAHRQLESKLRNIFDSVGDGIEIVSMDGRILDINRAGHERQGYRREEMVGRLLSEFTAPEFTGHIADRMAQISAAGHATFESARLHKNGSTIPLEINSRHIEFEGQPAFLGISRDISERVAAEQALRKLNEDLAATLDAIPDLLFELDQEGRYHAVWAHDEELLAAQKELLLGRTVAEVLPPQAATIVMDALRQAEANKYSHGQVISLDLPQGKFWFELSTAAKPAADATPRRFIMLSRDITDRMNTEAQLYDSHKKLSELYSLSPMGIALTDMQGHYLEFNEAFRTICGYTREELNQLDYWALTPREYEAQEAAQLEALNSKGYYGPYEKEYIRKDGNRIPLRLNGVLIRGSDGQPYIWSIVEDITQRKQAEAVLAASELRYRTLIENSPFCIHEIDLQGRLQSMNPAGLCMLRLDSEEKIRGVPYLSAVSPQDSARIAALMQAAFNGQPSHFEFSGSGEAPLHFKSCFIPIRNVHGKLIKLMGITEDITKRKQDEEALHITASVFDNTQEGILITDAANNIIDVNTSFSHITGYSREEVLGKNPKLLGSGRQDRSFYAAMWRSLAEKKSWRGEVWNQRKNGETYAELLSISVICDANDKVVRHVGVFSDITPLKVHEAELSRVAHYDALTGIPNRVLLADRMQQGIAQTAREQNMMAVCYLDLDGFKPINDTLGHETGDQVLIEVAHRIIGTIRGGDSVARLGGDEFVILLLGLEKGEECVTTLERLLHTIAQPIVIQGRSVVLGASIGVSIYPLDDEDADTLLRHADQAMYLAKQAGKHRFHIYDPSLDQRARSHHEFLKSIEGALQQDQFRLHYQPKIEMQEKRLVGAEALIRWQHPEKGLLLPAEFLPAVANTELDIRIGEWVIGTALQQLGQWRQAGLDIEISVNISAYHLESPGFVQMLQQQMARHPDLPAHRLQIEVLETTALEDVALVNDIITACRQFGVSFALDDFGTGYSSLSYLSRLPVDTLKIDQSFVRDMLDDKGDMAIVQGIIALAHAFEREIVAEGIETREHYQALLQMGCDIGQGYGIARPMPAVELARWHFE